MYMRPTSGCYTTGDDNIYLGDHLTSNAFNESYEHETRLNRGYRVSKTTKNHLLWYLETKLNQHQIKCFVGITTISFEEAQGNVLKGMSKY